MLLDWWTEDDKMIDPALSSPDRAHSLALTLTTALLFDQVNKCWEQSAGKLKHWLYPRVVLARTHDHQDQDHHRLWRWRNFVISFVHALLTGLGSAWCVYTHPNLLVEVIGAYDRFGYQLTCFSIGYFLYDTKEMVKHNQCKGSSELVVHHFLIILCFSNTVLACQYVGYNMVALMIEVSNILLHFRQLMVMAQWMEVDSLPFRTLCWLNLVFFFLFRCTCMVWLWAMLMVHCGHLPLVTCTIAGVSLVGITITTVRLLVRLVRVDFCASRK